MVGGFCWVLLFLFVPETFWDRTPRPKSRHHTNNHSKLLVFRERLMSHVSHHVPKMSPAHQVDGSGEAPVERMPTADSAAESTLRRPSQVHRAARSLHVGFAGGDSGMNEKSDTYETHDGHVSPNGHIDPIGVLGMTPVETPSSGNVQHLLLSNFHTDSAN
jgi:hypothetical protein